MTNPLDIIIIHGTEGGPEGNWFPWLAQELRAKGHRVFVPQFPTPDNQNIETWCKVLRKTCPDFGENTILIGHSTGATYLLSVLEALETPVRQTILVSGYVGPIGNLQYDIWNKSFYDKKFDWAKIRQSSNQIFLLHGDNDPYVPLSHAREIAQNLNIELTVIRNGGHLNAESGYVKFPLLRSIIGLLTHEDFIGSQFPESLHAPNGDLYPYYIKPKPTSQAQDQNRGKK